MRILTKGRNGFKPYNSRNQQKQPSQAEKQLARAIEEKPRDPQQNREPLQCWKCGGTHMHRNHPLENESARPSYNIQEVETVGQVERAVPRIYATLEDRQADRQSTVVEVAGKIVEQSVSILINPVSTHSYITPRVVDICSFKKVKHSKSWLVQLPTGTKRKVSEVVEKCPSVMNGWVTCVDLNVLPLGSYDVLIGMDQLEAQRVKLDCYNKTV